MFGLGKNIEVTSVSLDITSRTIYVGDSFTLSATVLPENATDSTVTWNSSNENVATVSDGVVTAKVAGTATITAKAGSRSATCYVTVLEKAVELSLGETWTVDGQWRFSIDSVENHYKCNSYSSKTGEQVVIIHYSYYNDGYTDSIQDLYFSGYSFDVYDENGTAASTYPCTHDTAAKVCSVGTNCSASAAFILPKSSDKITLNISKYPSNGSGKKKATYTLILNQPTSSEQPTDSEQTADSSTDYKSNAETVKNYILSDGKTLDEGYQYIDTFSNSTSNLNIIMYMPESDELVVTAGVTTGYVTGKAYIYYDVSQTKISKVVVTYDDPDLKFSYEAQADMDISSYTENTVLKFTATFGNPYEYSTEADFQDICNKETQLAVVQGNLILLMNLKMTLCDLGFTSYKIQ